MILEWLELLMWVLVALVVWLGVAILIAKTEEGEARDAQRDRADGGCRRDVTGTGRVAGQPSQAENPRPATPRLYSNVVHDHRDYGDEDPPRYETGTYFCQKCGARLFRARDGIRCPNCGIVSGRFPEPEETGPVGLGWNPSLREPAGELTEERLRRLSRRIARPYVKRRRDGVALSDEANADLMRKIFGEPE